MLLVTFVIKTHHLHFSCRFRACVQTHERLHATKGAAAECSSAIHGVKINFLVFTEEMCLNMFSYTWLTAKQQYSKMLPGMSVCLNAKTLQHA